jgi:hypothetical protein
VIHSGSARTPHQDLGQPVANRITELKLERGKIGMDGLACPLDLDGWLPHDVYRQLTALLPDGSIVGLDQSAPFCGGSLQTSSGHSLSTTALVSLKILARKFAARPRCSLYVASPPFRLAAAANGWHTQADPEKAADGLDELGH